MQDGFSQQWAEEAGRLVLAEIGSPTEDTFVSLIHLTMFWYCQGKWRRAYMFGCNSICAARLLDLFDSAHTNRADLSAEISRRRFWAAYIICHTSSRSDLFDVPRASIEQLGLPCNEDDFALGNLPEQLVALNDRVRIPSFYAEMIRLGDLWRLVRLLVRDTGLSADEKTVNIQNLDMELHQWRQHLPNRFVLTPTSVETSSPAVLSHLLLLNIVFHQCLCVLHSSIVPLFTFGPGGETLPHVQSSSAQTCFDHANQMTTIFEIALPWCTSHAPGFVGYAAYCASAIQLPFLWCNNPEVSMRAFANIRVNAKVLNGIGKRWKFVAGLEKHAQTLRQYHENRGSELADKPVGLAISQLNECICIFARTRTSLLGHNDIVYASGCIPDCGKIDALEVNNDVEEWLQNQTSSVQISGSAEYPQSQQSLSDMLLEPYYLSDDFNILLS
ncbi:hypothetical protein BGW36DRAFT_354822 [Talaromyces proteolyticus]|uniref:Transcription factor domain-containing protein n=1 Tax=Talaromyces proteolyticus TaxID=1131652 RepID=A0AAD4Q4V5_9EURO|nr:uncharacterized protein BGW36DRAFT_354822 [Talaromyces proteolyticus]KAH8703400.1 hypothetical protein BGW36DRAFT_354822 [Talaromyces proteolyticus]